MEFIKPIEDIPSSDLKTFYAVLIKFDDVNKDEQMINPRVASVGVKLICIDTPQNAAVYEHIQHPDIKYENLVVGIREAQDEGYEPSDYLLSESDLHEFLENIKHNDIWMEDELPEFEYFNCKYLKDLVVKQIN